MTVSEITALLDLMKDRGVTHLKMGDLELTLGQAVPASEKEAPRRVYSTEEIEKKARDERRRIMLGASGAILHRASGE